MKQLLIVASMALFTACAGTDQNTETTEQTETVTQQEVAAAKTYSCPMGCEGEKTYEEAGKCPVCKMDLTEVAMAETDSTSHNHQ